MRPDGARNLTPEESARGHYIKAIKKICKNCGHFKNAKCTLFPIWETVAPDHFCGQWKKSR
jgi:hypothetical protein